MCSLQGRPCTRRAELCERLGLTPAVLRRTVGGYSRGMKQKLGLVQALQHDPQLVVLDEPTEGLDPLVQEMFFELMEQAAADGRTVLLSSHVLPEVQRACGRVAIVREGDAPFGARGTVGAPLGGRPGGAPRTPERGGGSTA
nr:AAA family ATPase [Streptomyces virginiae]